MSSEDLDQRFDPMYEWLRELFPICRSLTGEGVRKTLCFLQNLMPSLQIRSVPSGTVAFDWVVPDEWNIVDAYVADEHGRRVIDFRTNNLHVCGYSEPVDIWLNRDELDAHLYSLPDQPDAIPYVTSYYQRRWGFCVADRVRRSLPGGRYHAVVQSTLAPGELNFGELILPGEYKSEILLSTYVCHPSMANNEVSGPVVTAALVRWLSSLPNRKHTYRILFIPETIGSIIYLSRHLVEMQQRTIAGFVVTSVGDERAYSFLPSRQGNTLADRVARHVLDHGVPHYQTYSFLDRGSDERQYCSPGVDLPVVSIMRSKYGTYPEYHTSLDNLDFVSQKGLEGAFAVLQQCLLILEANEIYRAKVLCEPQLGKRGLYPTISTLESKRMVRDLMNFMVYCDGTKDLLEISKIIGVPPLTSAQLAEKLRSNDLLEIVMPASSRDRDTPSPERKVG